MLASVRVFIGMLICLLPLSTYAESSDDAQIESLYVLSGLQVQLDQLPAMLQASFDETVAIEPSLKILSAESIGQMRDAITVAYAPAAFKKTVTAAMREHLTHTDIEQTLVWLESPLGKKCTALEEAAATPDVYVQILQFANEMKNNPASTERQQLLQQLDNAAKATETNIEIVLNTQVAVMSAVMATLPRSQQVPLTQIMAEAEQVRPQVAAMMEFQMPLMFGYVYQALSDTELAAYVAFARSPAGSNYQTHILKGIKQAFFDGSHRWGQAIGEILEAAKSQSKV